MVLRWFVFVLSSAVLAGSAAAARKPELQYQFNCSAKVDQWVCERQITTLRNIVERQSPPLPAGWVWLVVADSEWPALQRRYHLKHDYAFTHMGERRTVFNSLLFQQFDRPVWEWAVAHESAHVACDLVDDEAAERVARELVSADLHRLRKAVRNSQRTHRDTGKIIPQFSVPPCLRGEQPISKKDTGLLGRFGQ